MGQGFYIWILLEMTALIPEDLKILLAETLKSNPEDHVRVLFFLSKMEAEGVAQPYILSLQSVINVKAAFKALSKRLAQETKATDNDEKFRQMMKYICKKFLESNLIDCFVESERLQLAIQETSDPAIVQRNFMRNIAGLPNERFDALRKIIHSLCYTVTTDMDRKVVPASSFKYKADVPTNVLSLFHNQRRWRNDEIPKQTYLKNSINYYLRIAIVVIAGGVGGQTIYASYGRPIDPLVMIGMLLGLIGVCGSASSFGRKLIDDVFNLPESETLENAYNVLGVSPAASDYDVSSSYRRLALQHHPDKNGSLQKWLEIMNAIAVVRAARHKIQ